MPAEPTEHPDDAAAPSYRTEPSARPDADAVMVAPGGGGPGGSSRRFLVAGVGLLLVALVAGGVWWQSSRDATPGDADAPAASASALVGVASDTGVSFGSGARVIEVFVDYQCPHCSELEGLVGAELSTMLEADEVEVVIRPVKFISRASGRGAAAMYCAAPEDAGLAMHEALLADIGQDFSPDGLTTLAGTLGLDEATFGTCLTDKATTTWVDTVTDAARAEGLQSIPVVYVDGSRLSSEQLESAVTFRAAVLATTP